jgi:hypothetical protein
MGSPRRTIEYSSEIYDIKDVPCSITRDWYWATIEFKVRRQLDLHLTKFQKFILNKVSKELALKMAKVKLLHYEGQGLCAISFNGKTYKLD